MATKEDLLAAIANDPDLCDRGYEFADLDRRGYCHWVIDCARHLLPLAERHLSDSEVTRLANVLDCGLKFLDDAVDIAAVKEAISVPGSVSRQYCESHGEIPYYLSETLEAIADAVSLTIPDSKVYHEDVIYGAARAAYGGGSHDGDSADMPEESDCNDMSELAGTEQSDKEIAWQLEALKKRLLNSG